MRWLNKFWIIFKLIYLHFNYLILGLDHEYFYLTRAEYFVDLGCYMLAIGNLKKAQKESNHPRIKSALGYCYVMLGDFDKSVKNYREAYSKSKDPDIAVGLACAELNSGNIEECKKVILALSEIEKELEPCYREELIKLKKEVESPA